MELNEYQKQASATDRLPGKGEIEADRKEILVPLLGLSGEVGELLSEYKKYLRDAQGHELFVERIREELGDIIWYAVNVATKFGLSLEEVAQWNLEKTNARWGPHPTAPTPAGYCFDADYPENERLPRKFSIKIIDNGQGIAEIFYNGTRIGDRLRDNRYIDDGYRFHDIFHFSNAAVLGWSPITRWMLKCKRKSNPRTDEVEDGGRAIAIEEGISAMVFSYAEQRNFLANNQWISTDLLRTIKGMTSHLEVSQCTMGDWEKAIHTGFNTWRTVKDAGAANMILDLDEQRVAILQSR